MPSRRFDMSRDASDGHKIRVSTNERTAMTRTLHDLLIAVGALCQEPSTREYWLSDGNLRIRLMPMAAGWQRIDVFDLAHLSEDMRAQVRTLSQGQEASAS
jgi:hypothetical protein